MPWRAPGESPVLGHGCGVAGGGVDWNGNGGWPPTGMLQGQVRAREGAGIRLRGRRSLSMLHAAQPSLRPFLDFFLGFGRIVASEIEEPDMLVNMV
jgi:hypothetical protein